MSVGHGKMGCMTSIARALELRRLIAENTTLGMLRKEHLPIIAAVLGTHLGGPGERIATDELHERLDADLEDLRDHFSLGSGNGKSYCDEWRNAGILIRRPASAARGETYELSAAGFDALRILDQLQEPQSTLTESRLMTLATTLHTLAIDTDPNQTRRLEALERQRDAIDTQIARIRSGDIDVIDAARATERVTEVLLQAQNLPADFARVRTRFEELNHELRSSLLNSDNSVGSVLDDVFRGVDLIDSSDEGRTFAAFSALIRDPERSAAFDADVAAILDRDFAASLTPDTRRALRHLMRTMKQGNREVNQSLTEFARGLRRYVRSQDFQRDRELRRLLQDALGAAAESRGSVKPYARIGVDLDLTSMQLRSVGAIVPHDPSDFEVSATLDDAISGETDFARLAEIARETEIDFTELAGHVNHALEHGKPVTVAEILTAHPATQGVASVIGLLSLAAIQGEVTDDQDELRWRGRDGVERRANVMRHLFSKEVIA